MTSDSNQNDDLNTKPHQKGDEVLNASTESDQNHKTSTQEGINIKNMTTIPEIDLDHLKKELAECKDKYLRVLAESENARKRIQKEKQETIQYAIQNMIVDFLSPIDHMENALKFTQQMSDDVKHWALGFQMILTQFKDVLSINGVTPFESKGHSFDPHRHEAVETVATVESPPGIVIEECLRGYMMGDRTIRPARVKVSAALQEEITNNNNNNQ
ncbi:MAG: nucleotide exchange factor GrpE [Parachlamydiaceae bacterium]